MREGWTYKRLGDVCTIERGGSPRPIDAFITTEDKGLNWIKIGDAVEGSKYISSTKEKIKPEGLKKTRFVHKGDFILSNSMSFGKPYILNIDGCIHDGWLVIRDENDTFDKSFLYYLLGSPNMYREFKRLAVGGVVNNLNSKIVRDVIVPVPPLQEQERIVAELDLLTGIIDKQKQQLKELDTLAQSIFYDMFGSVDNNTKNFMVKCLNEVFQLITDGTHQTPQYTDDILHGFKFLSAKDVVSGVIDWTRIKYIPESLHNELYKRLAPRRGDILLCKNGTTGICALVETDEVFDIYVSLALLRTEKEYNKKYLVYAINNPSTKSQFDDSLKGVGVPNLHLREIKKTKILVPPIELQSSFAKKIESIESQKEFINRSIAESQKLFDYTMDKYFG